MIYTDRPVLAYIVSGVSRCCPSIELCRNSDTSIVTSRLCLEQVLFAAVVSGFITARCTLVQSAVLRSHIFCPSVRPCVTFRYRDHIGCNSWKIISRPNSLGPV